MLIKILAALVLGFLIELIASYMRTKHSGHEIVFIIKVLGYLLIPAIIVMVLLSEVIH
jgi:hypothetical protein